MTKTRSKKLNLLRRIPRKIGIIVAVLLAVALSFLVKSRVEAGWYNEKWAYRKKIDISYTGVATLTNHQVKLSAVDVDGLYSAGKIQANCSDIRFTDAKGTLLNYWIADQNSTSDSIDCTTSDYDIWVKIPSFGFGGTHIYMYYGNPTASSESNGSKVFDFFDDFAGAGTDGSKWDTTGSPAVSDGNLTLQDAGSTGLEEILSKNTFCDSSPDNGDTCVVEFRAEQNSVGLTTARAGFSNGVTFSGLGFDSADTTFTAGAAKRNSAGPFAAGVMQQGKLGDGSGGETIRWDAGNQISGNWYRNHDTYQGSIVFWITPEWNGNDGKAHVIFGDYDGTDSIMKTNIGLLIFSQSSSTKATVDVSSWTAGTTYLVVVRWDTKNTLDGTNYASISVYDSHTFGSTSGWSAPVPYTQSLGNHGYGNESANALIEGFTLYRRPLFDGTYGIDVGNGDEIQKINNGGSHTGSNNASTLTDSTRGWVNDELIGGTVVNQTDGSSGTITDNDGTTITATLSGGTEHDWDTGDLYIVTGRGGVDPTLVTGSWDVVFALPTNATTGALATGEGNAWTHPHASNLLPGNSNSGGFMLNGTYTNDGWNLEGLTSTLTDGYGGDVTTYKDTFIYHDNSELNFGISSAIDVGSFWSALNPSRGLVQFDVSSIPEGADITAATLSLYLYNMESEGSYAIGAHRGLVEWWEGFKDSDTPDASQDGSSGTYRNANGAVAWNGGYGGGTGDYTGTATDSVSVTSVTGWYDWDILTDVAAWVSGAATNYGIWLISESEATEDSAKHFASSDHATTAYRPKLVVNYTANPTVTALATGEKIYAGGYKVTSNLANQGIYDEIAVTAGNDFVVRGVVNSDTTCVPRILITGADDGEITHMDGTTSSTRTDPDVLLFTFEADATENIKVKLINTASSGTCYWHQVEVLANKVDEPSMENGTGTPWTANGWSNISGTSSSRAQSSSEPHSGTYSIYIDHTTSADAATDTNTPDMSFGNVFISSGGWIKAVSSYSSPFIGIREGTAYPQSSSTAYYTRSTSSTSWKLLPVIYRAETGDDRYFMHVEQWITRAGYIDDLYAFELPAVSLTSTPANLANSTESTGIRVDGTDTLTQTITELAAGSGTIKFKYTPRHSAANVAEFGISTPYIATFWYDANNYIKAYWSAANTITLAYSMGGSTGSDTYDATGDITAGTTYDFEINYTGGGDMNLIIDETTQITLATIPAQFATAPNTAHWGTDYNGTADSSQADATFAAPDSYSDSASFYFDSTTGGNHETETINDGNSETGTVAVAENTIFNNFLIIQKSSEVLFGVGTTTASHSTQVPNSDSKLRFETTDTTNSLILDHIFVRKLATTEPSAEAYGSYGDEEKGTGPIAHYTFDENKGEWAYNEVSSTSAKDPVLYLDMDDNVSGNAQTISDASGYGNNGATVDGANNTGMSCTVAGRIGTGACDFDGTDDNIAVSNESNFDFDRDEAFNFSAWIRLDLPRSGAQAAYAIVSKLDSSSPNSGWELSAYWNSSIYNPNKVGLGFTMSNTWGSNWLGVIAVATDLQNGIWYHVAISYDGSSTPAGMKIYINGVSQTLITTADALSGSILNNIGVHLGGRNSVNSYLHGSIDEVKIYDYALTPAQIQAEYANTSAKIVGATYQPGIIGEGALRFDGTNDYATMITPLADVQSVSFWAKPNTTSEYLVDLDGGTHYISVASGTLAATGFDNPTIYVNGEESTTIEANRWQLITVKTATAFDASALSIGKQASNYYQGDMDDLRIYNYALSDAQVKGLFNSGGGAGAANTGVGTSGAEADSSGGAIGPSSNSGSLTDGLVGYWRMDDNTGTTTVDSSGNGNTATLGTGDAAPGWSSGKFGSGLDFDGSNDNASINNNLSIQNLPSSAISVSTWIYITSFPSEWSNRIFVAKGNNNNYRWHIGITNMDSQNLWTGTIQNIANSISNHTTDPISLNTWYHVTMTYDYNGDRYTHIFINGKEIGYSQHTPMTSTYSGDSSYALNFGSMSNNYSFFDGLIDETRIYNRALSANEIEDLYLYGPGPIAEYSFSEGTSVNVHDTSENANHGITYSGANISELKWTGLGNWGNALDLDGSNDYIAVGDIGNVNSVSFWVKPATTTEYFVDLDGTANIDASSGTLQANGFTDPSMYVNGRQSTTITADTWNHVVITDSTAIDASAMNIGKISTNYLDGIIDEVKFYNYVLSQREIVMLYSTSRMPDPIGHWKFDEGFGTSAKDAISSGNDGTITGATWYNEGRFGKALDFDGSGDNVDFGDIDL